MWKLVPGLGMAPYVYRHHGTVAEIDVRLIGIPAREATHTGGAARRLPARPLRHRPFGEHEPATPAIADAALGG